MATIIGTCMHTLTRAWNQHPRTFHYIPNTDHHGMLPTLFLNLKHVADPPPDLWKKPKSTCCLSPLRTQVPVSRLALSTASIRLAAL